MHLSVSPYARCSPIGQPKSQYFAHDRLVKNALSKKRSCGSVLSKSGTPAVQGEFVKKPETLSVVGLRKSLAAGQLLLLSTDTSENIFIL